jgi:hypothetical protein
MSAARTEPTRQLSEAKMLEVLSQQLDAPEVWRARTQTVAVLEEDLVTTHKALDDLSEEYTVRFGDDADVLRIRGPEEREREEKEDQVRRLQTELVSVARKLADLKADLPDELELSYSIKHARGRYGDAILISPHLTLKQAKRQYADRESDRSLDHRGKYGVCAQYVVADRTPRGKAPGYHWDEDQDADCLRTGRRGV